MNRYYGHGKLLLTGEYVILDGGLGLAIPTKLGQSLEVGPASSESISWTSLDEDGNPWYAKRFRLDLILEGQSKPSDPVSSRLIQVLTAARQLNPDFLDSDHGYEVTSRLEFSRQWGLGSSSTLIYTVAQWAGVNPYDLLALTFGGSGYDIACASADSAITFRLLNGQPEINPVQFDPPFKSDLYFVHLNKKQDSREGIAHYRAHSGQQVRALSEISNITQSILRCTDLTEFQELIATHEEIIAGITDQEPVKTSLFADYPGAIKSLGAWGGDFVLVTGDYETPGYFKDRGYETVVRFSDMIL